MTRGTIALWLTHQSTELDDRAALNFVQQGLGPQRTRILFDLAAGHRPSSAIEPYVWAFDSREMRSWGYPMIGDTLTPGHAHFPVLRFFAEHPGYDCYWTVEYDVAYRGTWGSLLAAFDTDDSDLLTLHLRHQEDEPDWYWWRTLAPPEGRSAPAVKPVRALLVMARYSGAALRTMDDAHRAGWAGHFEAFVPTVLQTAGLKLTDLGGDGPFTPAARRGRYYSSFSCPAGALKHLGTVRYRPARTRAGLRRGFIYHPVKPSGTPTMEPWRHRIRDKLWALHRHWEWRRRHLKSSL